MTSPANRAFWVTGPGQCELRPATLGEDKEPGEPTVTVRSLYSGVSRGTESLVFNNRVPPEEYQRMCAPWQEGHFPYPVKYGYANVGEVIEGPRHLIGQRVFCLYPHQEYYRVPASAVTVLPDALPPERAVLGANLETAINGLWDAQPAIGDRVAVVGLGVVGLLVAWLVRQIPGVELLAVDTNPARKAVAEALGLPFSTVANAKGCDLVVHASGHGNGLPSALAMAGQEARIVELSWYGDAPVSVPLGQAFHPNRLELKSSQVGQIPPARQPRWSYQRRLSLALSLLSAPELDSLISGESRFDQLPEVAGTLFSGAADALCHRIIY